MDRLQRDQFVVNDNIVFDFETRLPIKGVALFLRNGGNDDTVISVQSSDDASTWGVVTFSTPTASAQATFTLSKVGQGVLLFTSAKRYLRVTCTARVAAGVFCSLIRYGSTNEITE